MANKQRFESTWRAKWTTDGAETVAEMATKMRAAADHLDEMAKAGVVLSDSVGDDYAFLETTDPTVAAEYGFQLYEGCGDEDCEECGAGLEVHA